MTSKLLQIEQRNQIAKTRRSSTRKNSVTFAEDDQITNLQLMISQNLLSTNNSQIKATHTMRRPSKLQTKQQRPQTGQGSKVEDVLYSDCFGTEDQFKQNLDWIRRMSGRGTPASIMNSSYQHLGSQKSLRTSELTSPQPQAKIENQNVVFNPQNNYDKLIQSPTFDNRSFMNRMKIRSMGKNIVRMEDHKKTLKQIAEVNKVKKSLMQGLLDKIKTEQEHIDDEYGSYMTNYGQAKTTLKNKKASMGLKSKPVVQRLHMSYDQSLANRDIIREKVIKDSKVLKTPPSQKKSPVRPQAFYSARQSKTTFNSPSRLESPKISFDQFLTKTELAVQQVTNKKVSKIIDHNLSFLQNEIENQL